MMMVGWGRGRGRVPAEGLRLRRVNVRGWMGVNAKWVRKLKNVKDREGSIRKKNNNPFQANNYEYNG